MTTTIELETFIAAKEGLEVAADCKRNNRAFIAFPSTNGSHD
jgi:hypothetical protein